MKRIKKEPWKRIRNPYIPALIQRRPNTHHEDKKKKHQRKRVRVEVEE
jgi:hypothetical protein